MPMDTIIFGLVGSACSDKKPYKPVDFTSWATVSWVAM